MAEAEFDARGTLGLDPEAPVGVGAITITAILDTDASDDELGRLARSTQRLLRRRPEPWRPHPPSRVRRAAR